MLSEFHPALFLLLFAAVFVGLAIYYRVRDTGRVAAQQTIHKREVQTYAQAEADYKKALATLEGRNGKPIVLDLINDLTFDPFSELAGEAPYYLDVGSATKILEKIKSVQDGQPIDIVIHTLGGLSLAAELIAAALHARGTRTRAYVPYIAMSGGTLVALATEEIWLGKNAALGPVDTQYWGFPAESYKKLLSKKHPDATSDHTLLRAYEVEIHARDAKRQACDIVHKAHKRLGNAPDGTCIVVEKLTNADRTHGDRVTFQEAKDIGMRIEAECPPEVYELVDARLQMIRARQQRIRQRLIGENNARGRVRFH